MNSTVSAPLPSHGVKIYRLLRAEDESGVSGEGHIAEIAVFSSGVAVMSWLTRPTSVGIYSSLDELSVIHGHGGKTIVEEVQTEDIMTCARCHETALLGDICECTCCNNYICNRCYDAHSGEETRKANTASS